jgi:hypothetical protein
LTDSAIKDYRFKTLQFHFEGCAMALTRTKLIKLGPAASGFSALTGLEALPTGGFAALVGTSNPGGTYTGGVLQKYDSNGRPVGDAVTTISTAHIFNVSVLHNGDFVFAKVHDGGYYGPPDIQEPAYFDVFLEQFDQSGNQLTPEFAANVRRDNDQYGSELTTLKNGNVLVAWDSLGGAISALIYSLQLAAITGEIKVGNSNEADGSKLGLVALKNGGFAISWIAYAVSGPDFLTTAKARIYDARGTPLTKAFDLESTVVGIQREIGLTTLSNGKFASAWYDETGSGSLPHMRIFNADGTAAGKQFDVGHQNVVAQAYQILGLSDGRLALAESAFIGTDGKLHLQLSFYDQSGKICGNPMTLDTADIYNPHLQSIGTIGLDQLKSGEVVVSWQFGEGDSTPRSIARAVVVNPLEFTGTAANDGWTGGNLNDAMSGAAGKDVFHGRGGSDVLTGGLGDDQLFGGAGADKLDGGDGSDTSSYVGDGPVTVSLLSPSKNTGAALGDRFLSIENLSGSNAADTLQGNGKVNLVNGNAGNDFIDGAGGDDTLRGDGGHDVLTGGEGHDLFDFTALSDSGPTSAQRDTIADFVSGTDHIGLHALDAVSTKAGNQNFTWIETQAFHKVAGELKYEKSGSGLVVSGDVNGDGHADFSILLQHVSALAKADFIL